MDGGAQTARWARRFDDDRLAKFANGLEGHRVSIALAEVTDLWEVTAIS